MLSPQLQTMKDAYVRGKVVPDLEIALAAYTVINEYRHLSEPTRPQKVADYYKLNPDTRAKMNKNPESSKAFWEDEEVIRFFDGRTVIRNLNWRNEQWLKWMKGVLISHPEKIQKIEIMLHQFHDIDHPDPINVPEDIAWRET